MTDALDLAADLELADRLAAETAARNRPGMTPTGACYWCAEPVEGERLFCDVECRDEFQERQETLRRQGRS